MFPAGDVLQRSLLLLDLIVQPYGMPQHMIFFCIIRDFVCKSSIFGILILLSSRQASIAEAI
jgi:hypothetical protein